VSGQGSAGEQKSEESAGRMPHGPIIVVMPALIKPDAATERQSTLPGSYRGCEETRQA